MKYIKFLVFVEIFLLYLSGTHSQLDPDDVEKINSFMAELMECRQMPGAAIALVKDNEIGLTQGYGFANLETQTPVTEDTLFAIASVSKSFTTTLMGKLFADGETGFTWDSVVSESADDIYFYNGYVTNHTMFRDLVSHQTGIPRHDAVWVLDAFEKRSDIVERIRFMDPRFEFRTDLLYTNIMFNMAMQPLEQRLSLTFEELLTDNLLIPLGMESTTFYDVAEVTGYEGFATPYAWDRENPDTLVALPFETWNGVGRAGPAASVSSTANDMAKWLRFILQEGISEDGTRVMEPADLMRLWSPEMAFEIEVVIKPDWPVTDTFSTYALAYFNGQYRGYKTHSHGGDLNGYHSEVYILPDMGLATFFTTNFGGHTEERTFVHRFLVDVMLGVEPAFNASFVCDYLEQNYLSTSPVQSKKSKVDNDIIEILKSLQFSDKLIQYYTENHIATYKGMPQPLVKEMHDIIESISDCQPSRQIESYTGEYGSFNHGNLTVSLSEACEGCLYMQYGKLGQYTLQPTNNTDVFIGRNEYYIYDLTPVIFAGSDENGNSEFVSPIVFEITDPPVFERGLSMAEAPPPNIDICHF